MAPAAITVKPSPLARCLAAIAWRGGWPALALLIALSLAFRLPRGGPVQPQRGDLPAYLAAAFHLRTQFAYTASPDAADARPALGREPAYPLLLAAIMAIDPDFGRFTPACLKSGAQCPRAMFRTPSLANLALIVGAAVLLFVLARTLCATPLAGLIAAAYLLLNTHANKLWADLMSDRLAVFLVCLALLALAFAWRRPSPWRAAACAASFAALTLTKAAFLPFCLAAIALAAAFARPRRAVWLAGALYLGIVGGWCGRNWAVSGMFRLTDARSGIALSTRAVFDAMSPREYAASLVYFTDSIGPKLATSWFGADLARRFAIDTPGGYYDTGQNGYDARIAARMARDHLKYWQAANQIDHEIVAGMVRHWPGWLVTMLPLTWRGIWIDNFVLLGLPCLIWTTIAALRRRHWQQLALLALGIYNLLFYAAISLNIERYQLTALPSMALAVAIAATRPPRGA